MENVHYDYDAVGNILTRTQTISNQVTITAYGYDAANRLTAVNGITNTWDNAGNLRSDGTYTYTYDAANRLIGVSGQALTTTYRYNGLGDRVSQTVNGVTTNYTLDLNAGLTQVLVASPQPQNPSTQTFYLYGLSRIGELQPGGFLYHLTDALGSVRQLVDASGAVKLAQSYEPYGKVMSSSGSGSSVYAFTGEAYDATTGLVFLRARYLSTTGRFLTKDTWSGSEQQPMSFNAWLFTFGNPVNLVDRDGRRPCTDWLLNSDSLPYYGWHAVGEYQQCLDWTPNAQSYSEKVDPWNLTWDGPPGATIVLADIRNTLGKAEKEIGDRSAPAVAPGTYGSQFYIQSKWSGLCGHVSVAAILSALADGKITANEVVQKYQEVVTARADDARYPNYAGRGDLETLISKGYGSYLEAMYGPNTESSSHGYTTEWNFPATSYSERWGTKLDELLVQRGYFLIAGVTILDASPTAGGGRIATNKYILGLRDNSVSTNPDPALPAPCTPDKAATGICHWVVITGISHQWDHGKQNPQQLYSSWNWLRVYNPFDNQTEYYPWKDFQSAWNSAGYQMLAVKKK